MGYLASGYEMISIFNQRAPLFLQSKVAESTFERYVIPDVVDCDSSLYARTTLIMIENHVLHEVLPRMSLFFTYPITYCKNPAQSFQLILFVFSAKLIYRMTIHTKSYPAYRTTITPRYMNFQL